MLYHPPFRTETQLNETGVRVPYHHIIYHESDSWFHFIGLQIK